MPHRRELQPVILSAAKDLSLGRAPILRWAERRSFAALRMTAVLKFTPMGRCPAAPGQDFALLAVENQSVLVDCSQAFEPQFEQHAASTEVPALHYKPLDRHLASAHIVSAGRSYC